MNTPTNAYVIKGRIEQQTDKRHQLTIHLHNIERGLTVFRVVTFLMYIAFTLSLYVGDVMHLQTLLESFLGSFLGFGLYLSIAIGLAYSLASFKHNFYTHRGIHGGALIMVGVVMIMGLTAEVFQASGQQDVKMRVSAENSQEYQQMVSQNPTALLNGSYADPYADKLIKLKGELGKAKELERTCIKTCQSARLKIEGLESQIAEVKEMRQAAATQRSADIAAAQVTHTELVSKVEEKHYNPTIRSIKETTGVGIGTAVTIIMGFISLIFEICHAYFSHMYNQTLKKINAIEESLLLLNGEYVNQTGREYRRGYVGTASHADDASSIGRNLADHAEPRRKESGVVSPYSPNMPATVSAFAPNLADKAKARMTNLAETLATDIARADYANKQVLQKAGEVAGSVGHKIDAVVNRPTPSNARGTTFREELEADGVIVPPADTAMDLPTGRNLADGQQASYRANRPLQADLADEVEKTPPKSDDQAERLAAALAEISAIKAKNAKHLADLASERAARLRAEKERADAEAAEAARLAEEAERGNLTQDQIDIAARAISAAIDSGITSLGFGSLAAPLKDVGLPRSNEVLRKLHKLALKQLSGVGRVKPNPAFSKGKPEFILA